MKNFLAGLLLGWLASYWYFTQADYARGLVNYYWARASAPPAITRKAN